MILNLANCNPLRSALIQSSIWRNFFCHWRAVICESKTRSVVPVRLRAQGLASKKRKENHQSSLILTYKRGKMTSEPRSVDSQFSSETKMSCFGDVCRNKHQSVQNACLHNLLSMCFSHTNKSWRCSEKLLPWKFPTVNPERQAYCKSLHFHKFLSIC